MGTRRLRLRTVLIVTEAIRWYAVLSESCIDDPVWSLFRKWLQRSRKHRRIFERVRAANAEARDAIRRSGRTLH